MKITTKSGFKCEINENRVKDWRFISKNAKLSKLSEVNEIEAINMVNELLVFVLGESGTEKLFAHIEKQKEIVEAQDVISEYSEIVNKMRESVQKKSLASST